MNEYDQQQRRDLAPGGTWMTVVLLLSPLLYVLSIGPVVRLAEGGLLPGESVRWFYQPVIWLHHHTPLAWPLEWYSALWGWR